jgi:DNA-binding NtrC family response regulator
MPQDEFHTDVLRGARVLILDDSFVIAADLDLIIEDAGGHTVALASSIEQALRFLTDQRVDAVVLEFKLREGNADAVLDAVRRHGVASVIYTGMIVCPDFQRRHPDAKTVAKPAPPEVLVGALRAALKNRYLAAA